MVVGCWQCVWEWKPVECVLEVGRIWWVVSGRLVLGDGGGVFAVMAEDVGRGGCWVWGICSGVIAVECGFGVCSVAVVLVVRLELAITVVAILEKVESVGMEQ